MLYPLPTAKAFPNQQTNPMKINISDVVKSNVKQAHFPNSKFFKLNVIKDQNQADICSCAPNIMNKSKFQQAYNSYKICVFPQNFETSGEPLISRSRL